MLASEILRRVVAQTAQTNGVGAFVFDSTIAAAAMGVPSGVSSLLVSLLTPEIDYVAGGTINLPATTLPGLTFAPTGSHSIISLSTAVTVAPVVKAGNDGATSNILSSQTGPTLAQWTAGKNSVNNLTIATKPLVMVDLTTPISVVVSTPATATAAKGYIRLFGWLNATVP